MEDNSSPNPLPLERDMHPYEFNGIKFEIGSRNWGPNPIYYIRLNGKMHELYGEGLYDRDRPMKDRRGSIFYMSSFRKNYPELPWELTKEIERIIIKLENEYDPNGFIKIG